MAPEEPGMRELAKFMTDHILCNVDRYVLFAVMHRKCQPDHVRDNG